MPHPVESLGDVQNPIPITIFFWYSIQYCLLNHNCLSGKVPHSSVSSFNLLSTILSTILLIACNKLIHIFSGRLGPFRSPGFQSLVNLYISSKNTSVLEIGDDILFWWWFGESDYCSHFVRGGTWETVNVTSCSSHSPHLCYDFLIPVIVIVFENILPKLSFQGV